MIMIVDYGMGNFGSMLNMLKRIGVDACVQSDPAILSKATRLILPGVGAFDAAMRCINSRSGLREVLEHKAMVEKIPVLGVCLGMQILTQASEEGSLDGLGWIPGVTSRFPKSPNFKVPHMGWNISRPIKDSPLVVGVSSESRYYFVHSYYVRVSNPDHVLMRASYGVDFDAAIGTGNIFGVQFHPEKSHRFGMSILKNFSEL